MAVGLELAATLVFAFRRIPFLPVNVRLVRRVHEVPQNPVKLGIVALGVRRRLLTQAASPDWPVTSKEEGSTPLLDAFAIS